MYNSAKYPAHGRSPRLLLLLLVVGGGLLGCGQEITQRGVAATAVPFLPAPLRRGQGPASSVVSGHIVFVSNRDGPTEIYVMNADGSAPRRMTRGEGGNAWPSLSPDGKLILFQSSLNNRPQIFVMTSAGQDIKSLAASQFSDEFPSWSPDGSRIAFTSDRDGHVGIYVMNADGSSVTRLMDEPSNNWFPVWAPDGKSIAFISDRDGTNGNIFAMDLNGNHLEQLTTAASLAAKPTWAPDSRHLAVFTGGGFVAVARGGGDPQLITLNGEDPAWSPDGKWIAFASRRDSSHLQIYVTTPDGSSMQRITKSTGEDSEPAWGP